MIFKTAQDLLKAVNKELRIPRMTSRQQPLKFKTKFRMGLSRSGVSPMENEMATRSRDKSVHLCYWSSWGVQPDPVLKYS